MGWFDEGFKSEMFVVLNVGLISLSSYRRTSRTIICETGKSDKTCVEEENDEEDSEGTGRCSFPETVSASFDYQSVRGNLVYEYINDPVITSVRPLRAIVSGGIKITVKGEFLDSIQTAVMVLMPKVSRRRRSASEFVGVSVISSGFYEFYQLTL